MRHNNNGRRFRGRSNNGSGGGQGGHHSHGNGGGNSGGGNHSSGSSGGNRGRMNPRMQTFDSNGPEVRIRGNAYQINEKYTALARDAMSASDRVLAESYLQHAEHYQRMINEMTEEYNKYNPQPQYQQQPITGEEPQPEISVEQPSAAATQQQQQQQHHQNQQQPQAQNGGMEDLDQSFLRPRVKEAETV